MSAVFFERNVGSRSGTTDAKSLLYYVFGTDSETEVETLCRSNIPIMFSGLRYQTHEAKHVGGLSTQALWEIKADYGVLELPTIVFDDGTGLSPEPAPYGDGGTGGIDTGLTGGPGGLPGDLPGGGEIPNLGTGTGGGSGSGAGGGQPLSMVSFDTTGGTEHITQVAATNQFKYSGDGSTAPDMNGTIGNNGETIDGVDIVARNFAWKETHTVPKTFVTVAYVGTLYSLTGTINNAHFRHCRPGECLFEGVQGSQKDKDSWELSFAFRGRGTKAYAADYFGSGSEAISRVYGWDYTWVLFKNATGADTKIKIPRAVYVARVYDLTDFSLLRIGD